MGIASYGERNFQVPGTYSRLGLVNADLPKLNLFQTYTLILKIYDILLGIFIISYIRFREDF